MPTTVVGFRLGNDTTSRQVTVLVTEIGVLHRCHGLYGRPPRTDLPQLPIRFLHPDIPSMQGEHPMTRPIRALREHHTDSVKKGYTRDLIPPACLSLDMEEYPLPPKDRPREARPHPELMDEFTATAPGTPQSLDLAVDTFRAALGLPVRPRNVAWRPRQAPVPARVVAMLRTLAHGSPIEPRQRRAAGWRVTPQSVTLRVGSTAETLDRQSVLELQAALTAWLRYTERPSP